MFACHSASWTLLTCILRSSQNITIDHSRLGGKHLMGAACQYLSCNAFAMHPKSAKLQPMRTSLGQVWVCNIQMRLVHHSQASSKPSSPADPDHSKRGSLNGTHADTACEAAIPQAAVVSTKEVLTVSQSCPADDRQEQQHPARSRTRLAPSGFYGSERLRLIDERLARLFASAYRCSEGSASVLFEKFWLQQQAFTYADTHELAGQLR